MNAPDLPRHPWHGTALIDRSNRARLSVSGPDRARFLHNLTTNDVKRLGVGAGREAFVTSPQGKTLAYIIMHAIEDRILVRADAGGLEHALPHFQKYGAFDDVALDEVGESTCEIHIVGPDPLPDWLGSIALEAEYSLAGMILDGERVLVVRESPTGFAGLTLIAPASMRQALWGRLSRPGTVELDRDQVEGLRITAGIPAFGRELTPANLPQELGRDHQAISFVKGCYLGQETVARIDALGHVNRILKGLCLEPGAEPPAAGARLMDQEKAVGTVTSAARSPHDGSPIALAFVKTSHAVAGTRLAVPPPGKGEPTWAVVADLPLSAASATAP